MSSSVICRHRTLVAHSQADCYVLDEAQIAALQTVANTITLEPGRYVIRIHDGEFNYWSGNPEFTGEPWVILWLYGGEFINKKTGVPVGCTWTSLNGYDEALNVEVLSPTTLCGLFFDTYGQDNSGKITLSILTEE